MRRRMWGVVDTHPDLGLGALFALSEIHDSSFRPWGRSRTRALLGHHLLVRVVFCARWRLTLSAPRLLGDHGAFATRWSPRLGA